MSGAREAVARVIDIHNWEMWTDVASEILEVLRPIIAAEIRAWADEQQRGVSIEIAAEAIASRICGGEA